MCCRLQNTRRERRHAARQASNTARPARRNARPIAGRLPSQAVPAVYLAQKLLVAQEAFHVLLSIGPRSAAGQLDVPQQVAAGQGQGLLAVGQPRLIVAAFQARNSIS